MNPEIPPTIPTQSAPGAAETMPDPYLQAGQPSSGGGGKVWIILTIVFGLLLIAVGAFSYVRLNNLNKQISSQNAQINSLTSQVSELQSKNTTLTEEADKVKTISTPPTDSTLVSTLAKNQSEASVGVVVGKTVALGNPVFSTDKGFATVSTNAIVNGQNSAGGSMFFKKVNGSWVYIGTVQQETTEFKTQFGIPTGF